MPGETSWLVFLLRKVIKIKILGTASLKSVGNIKSEEINFGSEKLNIHRKRPWSQSKSLQERDAGTIHPGCRGARSQGQGRSPLGGIARCMPLPLVHTLSPHRHADCCDAWKWPRRSGTRGRQPYPIVWTRCALLNWTPRVKANWKLILPRYAAVSVENKSLSQSGATQNCLEAELQQVGQDTSLIKYNSLMNRDNKSPLLRGSRLVKILTFNLGKNRLHWMMGQGVV